MIDWDVVEDAVERCSGIAFDTCHKIYVLMDDNQMHLMKSYGYGEDDPSALVYASQSSSEEMLATIKEWYEDSCPLKFVQAVSTVEGNANEGFRNLIEQGATDQEPCDECGDEYCDGWACREMCENCGDDDIYNNSLCKYCYEDSLEEEEDE